MSYGGTALIVMLASMGIVANVSRQVEDRPRRGTKSQLRT